MADQEQARTLLAAEFAKQIEGKGCALGVEVSGGLVGEHEVRLIGEGASHRDALLLPEREGPGSIVKAIRESEANEELTRPLAVRPRPEGHAEQDVLQCGVSWKQVEALENVADVLRAKDVARGLGEGLQGGAAESDATGVGAQDAGHQMQQRGLPRATLAGQRDSLSRLDREARNPQYGAALAVRREEVLLHVFELE